jgi:hypothetical protein
VRRIRRTWWLSMKVLYGPAVALLGLDIAFGFGTPHWWRMLCMAMVFFVAWTAVLMKPTTPKVDVTSFGDDFQSFVTPQRRD